MFDDEKEDKFKQGVDMILLQWPLYSGVLETKWNEFEKKKLRLLPQLIDTQKYNFDKMPLSELRAVFVNELTDFIFGMV